MNNYPDPTILKERIAEFCKRWGIQELALFGSALRDDFRPDSDLDIVITFAEDAGWSLLDHIRMRMELQHIFHRDVDLITRRALEKSQNWVIRDDILKTAQVLFRSGEESHAAG
jgi:hypothetical protein